MKKTLLIILAGCMAAAGSSCKKYLDIKPKGAFIPEKTGDYRLLLDEVSSREKSTGFFNTYTMDMMLDDDISINDFALTFYQPAQLNAFRFSEHLFLEFETDPDWLAMYNQIYTANLVVEQVMDATDGSEAVKRQLLAEARVHRAYAYFILVNLYAKQYNAASAASDPGVPIREGLDFEETLTRASVQVVYDYILDNLSKALPDLPAAPDPAASFRPTKPAAFTLLAKTYLYMNNAAEAHRYADSSLARYSTLIDYNTLPPHPAFPQDVIVYPMNFRSPEALMEKSSVTLTPLVYASSSLLALYDKVNDLRFKAFFLSDAVLGLSNGYISNEWSGRNPAKGPSVPETYLIRAESSARLGRTADAMADLNLLRSKRYANGADYTLDAGSPAEALDMVKTERRREMPFRGSRFFDIRRYNMMDNANITITHTLPDGTFSLAPNSNRTALPIARKYIALNPEIAQNPR